MGHISDKAAQELAADANKLLKRVPSDMRRDLKEHLKVLVEFGDLDPGTMPETRKVEKSRDQRDEAAADVWALLDQFEAWEAEQPVDHGPVKSITTPSAPNVDGWVQTITYQDGTVEERVLDTEAMNKVEAMERFRIDEREGIANDLWGAERLRGLAASSPDQGAAAAYRERADELEKRAAERKEALISSIVEDARARGLPDADVAATVRSYNFPKYELPDPAVEGTLELLAQDKTQEAYEQTVTMNPDQRYKLMGRLAPDQEERLLAVESERREAAARTAREAGML